jgi:phosphohistidine phosphatase
MKLLLLRHGLAVEPGTAGFERDSERPLTPEGRRKMRLIARALARLGVEPDVILTSPLVRAHQTAEIVATGLRLKKRLRSCEHLACGGDAKRLIAEINRHHANAGAIMLVGHEPDLSELASLLISGQPGGAGIQMKKGGLCVLEAGTLRAGRCATLVWLAPPKLLAG